MIMMTEGRGFFRLSYIAFALLVFQEGVMASSSNLWSYLNQVGGEPSGYRTYSYILVGDERNEPILNAMHSHIDGIMSNKDEFFEDMQGRVSAGNSNLFLIPGSEAPSGDYHPDVRLSKSIRSAFQGSSGGFELSHSGPFIVTTTQRIIFNDQQTYQHVESIEQVEKVEDFLSSDEREFSALYVDLTQVHSHALEEYIRSYATTISRMPLVAGTEKFSSLRLKFLDTILHWQSGLKSAFGQVGYVLELAKPFYDNGSSR